MITNLNILKFENNNDYSITLSKKDYILEEDTKSSFSIDGDCICSLTLSGNMLKKNIQTINLPNGSIYIDFLHEDYQNYLSKVKAKSIFIKHLSGVLNLDINNFKNIFIDDSSITIIKQNNFNNIFFNNCELGINKEIHTKIDYKSCIIDYDKYHQYCKELKL